MHETNHQNKATIRWEMARVQGCSRTNLMLHLCCIDDIPESPESIGSLLKNSVTKNVAHPDSLGKSCLQSLPTHFIFFCFATRFLAIPKLFISLFATATARLVATTTRGI